MTSVGEDENGNDGHHAGGVWRGGCCPSSLATRAGTLALFVGPDETDDLVPAGEATLPVDRDAHIFAIALDVNDDLVLRMPDDFLAISVGRAGGVPERVGQRRVPRTEPVLPARVAAAAL